MANWCDYIGMISFGVAATLEFFETTKRQSRFDAELLSVFQSLRYGIICVVIDKKKHILQYPRTAFPPYHYCMKLMLERYCYFLDRFGFVGDVMAEKRGKSEDRSLQEAFSAVYSGGTELHRAKFFQDTLTSKEIKFKDKSHNINGLQLADMLAHPVRLAVLKEYGVSSCTDGPFGNKVREAVAGKYNRNFDSDKVRGYGLVLK